MLIHVDTHQDCSYFREEAEQELANLDVVRNIEDFVSPGGRVKYPVEYGNWIPALLQMTPLLFDEGYLICHKNCILVEHDLPKLQTAKEERFWSTDDLKERAICFSFDIDYYFEHAEDEYRLRSSFPDPTRHFEKCLQHMKKTPDAVSFIALSPTCCGGWHRVFPFLRIIERNFDISLISDIEENLQQSYPVD